MNDSSNGSNLWTSTELSSSTLASYFKFYLDMIIMVVLFYMTICQLIIFFWKKRYRVNVKTISDVLSVKNLPFFMNITLISSMIIGLSTMLVSNTSYLTSFTAAIYSAGVILNGLSLTSVYLLLWLRQTMFHTDNNLKHLSSKPSRIFSRIQGFFIVTFTIVLCIIIGEEGIRNDVVGLIHWSTWITVTVLVVQLKVQVALLLLFLIPMIRHQRNLQNSSLRAPPEKLIRLMRRSVISAVVAVVSDLTTFVLFRVSQDAIFYNVNILVNLISALFCFVDWRQRFLPCLSSRQN